jgi:ABC-type Mn2+/Zn2+ transport system ATPase subunit
MIPAHIDFTRLSLAVVRRADRGSPDAIVFSSTAKWLHPLFELESFLAGEQAPDPADCIVYDKAIGKAAAVLIIRMGFREVHTALMSALAEPLLTVHGVRFSSQVLVPRIQCRTEDSLEFVDNLDEAFLLIKNRAGGEDDSSLLVESLSVSLAGRRILRNLSLVLRRGERLLIRGPNGSGKSTFIKSLLGLIPVEEGRIKILGAWLPSRQWRERRGQVGYVSQENPSTELPLTAGEVVELATCRMKMGKKARDELAGTAMKSTGVLHLRSRLFSTLSGGEKQRVSIARCLAQAPKFLVLDEPSAHLDQDVLKVLDRVTADRRFSVLMTSHDKNLFDLPGWNRKTLDGGRLN